VKENKREKKNRRENGEDAAAIANDIFYVTEK
jgi:hypothetical protein